jgi:hypothetical protein
MLHITTIDSKKIIHTKITHKSPLRFSAKNRSMGMATKVEIPKIKSKTK